MKIIKPYVELIDNINPANIYNKIERCGRVSHLSHPREEAAGEIVRNCSAVPFVRMLIKRGHESVLEHVSLTFHIVTDRAIMGELTRHRHASFTVESTRYVKYDELTAIEQFREDIVGTVLVGLVTRQAEKNYRNLLKCGCKPEEVRAVLPLCLKSELYMTANLRAWRHILKIRTSKAAHPQMRLIAEQILAILKDKLPVIFEDIKPC